MRKPHVYFWMITVTGLFFLASARPAAANATQLNINISNDQCTCTGLGFTSGEFIVQGDQISVSVTFSLPPMSIPSDCEEGDEPCDVSSGPGGSIELVITPGAGPAIKYTGTFLNAGLGIDHGCGPSSEGATPNIIAAGTFTLNGFNGVGTMFAGDSCFHPELDSADLSFSGTATPEPGTLTLLATGLLALGPLIRRHLYV